MGVMQERILLCWMKLVTDPHLHKTEVARFVLCK